MYAAFLGAGYQWNLSPVSREKKKLHGLRRWRWYNRVYYYFTFLFAFRGSLERKKNGGQENEREWKREEKKTKINTGKSSAPKYTVQCRRRNKFSVERMAVEIAGTLEKNFTSCENLLFVTVRLSPHDPYLQCKIQLFYTATRWAYTFLADILYEIDNLKSAVFLGQYP